jgi:hypothetical protein
MSKNTGAPAFPSSWNEDVGDGFLSGTESGMTLRDYFAAKAMQAIIMDVDFLAYSRKVQSVAESAYTYADAMLVQRDK